MAILPTAITLVVMIYAVQIFYKITQDLPDYYVTQLLFDGAIDERHTTKFFLTQITDRYKESIKGFNGAMAFNIGFALIAFYAYFALPSNGSVTIPFVSLSVNRLFWISVAPFISFVLQTIIFTSFVWFMMLRIGMRLLYEKVGTDDFGDVMDLLLNGALGHIWIISKIGENLKLKGKLRIFMWIWYTPIAIMFLVIMASPILTSCFFIFKLFVAGSIILGIIYSVIFIFFFPLYLILLVIASLLGVGGLKEPIKQKLEIRTNLSDNQIQSVLNVLK